MNWERLDLSTLEPDILKLVAAATDPSSRLTPAAIRETALALLARARECPALAVPDDDVPAPSKWVGTRYTADKGETEVTFWKEDADALFQAEWENRSLRLLLVQIGERIWTSDPERLRGWDYDPRRALETVDEAHVVADWKSRADELISAWDRENHPKSGWRCVQCGWLNHSEDTSCGVCFSPQHPVTVSPRAEWKEHAAAPPPPFDEPGVGKGEPGQAVDLHLSVEVDALLREADSVMIKTLGAAKEKARDRTADPVSENKTGPRQCWRCKAELRKQTRICPRCGADQQDAPKPDNPARPSNLPE